MTKKMVYFDEEEKDLIESVERGEWHQVPNFKKSKLEAEQMARAWLAKNERISLRLSTATLTGIKQKALERGIPYQTLISSLLHQFVTGQIKMT